MVRLRGKPSRGICPERSSSGGHMPRSEPSSWRVWGQRPGQPKFGITKIILQGDNRHMFQDKTLVCKDCGAEFVFTAGEQEFYAEKGFQNEPIRCKACRNARKSQRSNDREMYDAVCAQCGAPTKIPFVPKNDRPIYCSACFQSRRG